MPNEQDELTTEDLEEVSAEGISEGSELQNEIVEDTAQESEEEVEEEAEEVEEEAAPKDQWGGDYDKLRGSYDNLRVYANRVKQEADLRFANLEGRLNQINQPTENITAEERFEQGVKQNPRQAVEDVARNVNQETANRLATIEQQQHLIALERVEGVLMGEHEDYADMKPVMNELWQSGKYAHLVNPKNPNAPEYLEFLYFKARETNKGDIVRRAKKQGKEEAAIVQRNKKKAFAESAGKNTGSKQNFKDKSLAEMEKELGLSTNRTATV